MKHTIIRICVILSILNFAKADEGLDFFENKIRPLLSKHCYQCHSAAKGKMKSGLALDYRDGLLKGGESGPVITPGVPTKSLLLDAVRHTNPKLMMPSEEDKLSDREIADLEKWIEMGAPDPREAPANAKGLPEHHKLDLEKAREHWSLKPIQRPKIPESKYTNPIDAFVFSVMERKGIEPAKPADRATWLRRVSYSATGLPPSVKELNDFEADQQSDAEARREVVERLLSSKHYGVHWGRHWLDVVRFGETSGAPGQWPIEDAWRYRDYVVDAFNEDKPFPQFVREQLAGDLMVSQNNDQKREYLIATGYLALARRFENKSIMYHLMLEDVIDNLGQTFLGLTLACARCHDHKFDPVPTADYYSLYGIFRSTRFPYAGKEHFKAPAGITVLGDDQESQKVAALYKKLLDGIEQSAEGYHLRQSLRAEVDALKAINPRNEKQEQRLKELTDESNKGNNIRQEAKKMAEDLRKKIPDNSKFDTIYAVQEGKPRNARIQRRGEPYNQGDEVPRGFLSVLDHATLPEELETSGRLELANWIASNKNPLTARVLVNRIWLWNFGRGLVTTPNDFGTRGAEPTHPELLDYLASWFMENGWSIKKLNQLILTSESYALSAENEPAIEKDPANELYTRFSRRCLRAEELRDSLLFVSGQLNQTLGGSHGSFVIPVSKRSYSQGSPWRPKHPEIENKRSLYLFHHRSIPNPVLAIFDGADSTVSTPARTESNTALQGLFFLNSPLFHHCANKLSKRLVATNLKPEERLEFACKLVMGRKPTEDEFTLLNKALRSKGSENEEKTWGRISRILLSSNAALFVE